jgi:hypothetical protein
MIKHRLSYILLFSILLLIFSEGSHAQMIKEFHRNKNDYFLDLTAVLQGTSNKEYLAKGETLLENFAGVWESGYFKPHHREKIYDVSESMLNKTMRAYPHFYEFASCLLLFVEKKFNNNDLELWLTELDTLQSQRSSKAMSDFLEYTLNLFENSMLYETRSRAWYFRDGRFSFGYDTLLYLGFTELDLICSTGRDSMEIKKTNGRYYPSISLWSGNKGIITWRRAGFDEDSVYAELSDYQIDAKSLTFTADSAVLYNKLFFDFPIQGVLYEKILSSPPGKKVSYPRFDSYFKDYEILGLYKNINYEGGFGMEGTKLICMGKNGNTARFIFKKGGDYFAVIRSRQFYVEDDKIKSSPASFAIYFDKDSIYHPGLQMKYDHSSHMLSLIRLNRGIAQSPFFDDYHKLDMYCEALYWVMNTEEISFEMIRGISQESKAAFESDKFYSAFEYYKLQGIDDVNPLVLVRKYAERYGSRTVKVGAFANYINKPVEQAVSMLLLLDARGFVVYDSDNRDALIKQRLYDYLKAHAGDMDYDVINFTSVTNLESNATIELSSFDLQIRGVPEISLSDSQTVYIYPLNEEIVMKSGKDFSFTGRVRAGLFEFYAQDCYFEYDTFKISMPQIDSMSFFVKVPDTSENQMNDRYYRVQAMVENMNGYLMIDRPDNKSGLKFFPEYPIFTSIDNSFVYFEGNSGQEEAYNREQFYYELDPFTLDSLDNFSTTGLRFQGYLASNGIFPPLEEPLVVMPDYSLGFNSYTKDVGVPLYGDKAMFYDTIIMDNSGLHGSGRMEYMTSVTESEAMDFYPDSVVSLAKGFRINKQLDSVEYAEVSAGNIRQKWLPDTNIMILSMIDEPFTMYDSTARFEGNLQLSPEELVGEGSFVFERAVINSEDFIFGHHSMGADTSDFKLYTDTSFTEIAFLTEDYRTSLDFEQRKGNFLSTGVSSLIDIPFNKFICSMDEIEWEMDEQIMRLQNNIAERIPDLNQKSMSELIDLDLSGSEFISTRPDQDSLRFFSVSANYDLQKNIIYAEDVKIIKVADAAVFPGDGKLNILKDAQIETLKYADILTDTAGKFHHIYDANVDIFSRHNYTANGLIDYLSEGGEAQQVFFSSIGVDSIGRTFATARIIDSEEFMLSPQYSFIGNVRLEAWQQYLHFDGSFSINQDCFSAFYDRVFMDTIINPSEILIPVTESLMGPDSSHILTGLMYSTYSDSFYPAFLTAGKNTEDVSVLSASGLLSYNREEEAFTVANNLASGSSNYLTLHNDNCILEGVGDIDFAMELPHVNLDLYGRASHFIIPDSTSFELVMGFDFFFDNNVLKRFSGSLIDANLPGNEAFNPEFMDFLSERIQSGGADRIISDLSTYGTIRRLPEGVKYTVLLNNLKFKWNPSTASMVSYGDIGVFSIGDEVVNRLVPGYVEIERKPSGYGVVSMYFEIPGGDWYFFTYRNYILQVISSNEGFNGELLNLGEDKRIMYSKDEDLPYEFVISSRRKMVDFVRKMEDIHRLNQR